MWIGASIISVFELVALGFYAAQAYVRKRKDSMGSSIRQNVIQPPKKISLGSSSGAIYRPRNTTPSTIKSRLSLLADDPDQEPLKMEASDDTDSGSGSKHSTAASKMSFPYWPPGQELPCTCKFKIDNQTCYGRLGLYNSNGNLITMKPLCRKSFAIIGF